MGVRFLIDKAFQKLLQLIYYLQSNVPFCSRINKAKVNKTKHTNSILIQRMQIYLFILPHIDRNMFYWKKSKKVKNALQICNHLLSRLRSLYKNYPLFRYIVEAYLPSRKLEKSNTPLYKRGVHNRHVFILKWNKELLKTHLKWINFCTDLIFQTKIFRFFAWIKFHGLLIF